MWHDNETTVDYLNFGVVADACAALLRQADGEPISIGVSGGWGVGKTSLVRMVEARLNDDDAAAKAAKTSYVVVTFNPWLYQDFESARNALLQMVGDAVLRCAADDKGLMEKAQGILKRIRVLRVLQLGGEAAVTLATGIPVGLIGQALSKLIRGEGGDMADAPKVGDVLKPVEPVSLPKEIHDFREALEELLDELKITLVVFVDDLDRCLPSTAISTLESIRLLLFLKRSAFVVAADNDFIRSAVQQHFAGAAISSDVATNYFDKLIQVPLHVPRLGINEATAYIAMLLMERAKRDGGLSGADFERALVDVSKRLRTSWKGDAVTIEFLTALVGVDNHAVVELMNLAVRLAPLLATASKVNANPRLMKRFLNTVYLREALAKPQDIELDLKALAKWHLVERCDEVLANAIASQVSSANEGRVEVLRQAEQASRERTELPVPFKKEDAFHREWLALDPQLGSKDLRPLLHLSRDSATRDFGGDNLSPQGRELRDVLMDAPGANAKLTEAIKAAGADQAALVMAKVWQLKAATRVCQQAAEFLVLTEPCKQFPELGPQAAGLLQQIAAKDVGAGIVPTLYAQPWARPVVAGWAASQEAKPRVKAAIADAAKVR